MVMEYEFGDRMRMSEGHEVSSDVCKILVAEIPGAISAHRAGIANDKNGTDWWIEHASGKHLSVDCKVREKDWSVNPNGGYRARDDLALETWSVVEKSKIGWTRDSSKRSDYILWLWLDTGRWCLVPFPMLCRVFQLKWQEWRSRFQTNKQFTPDKGGYHSECVFVDRKLLWRTIYAKFSGDLMVCKSMLDELQNL